MAMKLYVGGLPYTVTDEELEQFFAEKGKVLSAVVIKDRDSGQSKGFGFVELEDDAAAQEAINSLNGTEMNGRRITVSQARPQEERRPRDNGGGNGGNFRKRY